MAAALAEPHPHDVHGIDDHLGWHEQEDGRYFYGLNVENGRIRDREGMMLSSILGRTGFEVETAADGREALEKSYNFV